MVSSAFFFFFLPPRWFPDDNFRTPWRIDLKLSPVVGHNFSRKCRPSCALLSADISLKSVSGRYLDNAKTDWPQMFTSCQKSLSPEVYRFLEPVRRLYVRLLMYIIVLKWSFALSRQRCVVERNGAQFGTRRPILGSLVGMFGNRYTFGPLPILGFCWRSFGAIFSHSWL